MLERARKRFDPAVELLSKAHDSFGQVEDLIEMSRTLTNLGLIRREQGLHTEALGVLERALRIKEQLGDTRGRSATLDEIAQVLLEMDRRGDAARAARQAIKAARAASDSAYETIAQVTLARVLRAQGRRRESITLLKTAVATMTRLGMTDLAANASDELGLMLKDTGARTRAAEHVKRASRPKAATSPIRSPEHAIEGLPLS
jgi:tetratricopeptide (TPR) repeat protein